jgi:hypothetical protein
VSLKETTGFEIHTFITLCTAEGLERIAGVPCPSKDIGKMENARKKLNTL